MRLGGLLPWWSWATMAVACAAVAGAVDPEIPTRSPASTAAAAAWVLVGACVTLAAAGRRVR